jgi:hypothetical protein
VFRHAGAGEKENVDGGDDVDTLGLASDKLEVKFAEFLRETLIE